MWRASRLVLLTAAGAAALLLPKYQRDKREALDRLRAGSTVLQTPSGPLEYATAGEGYPVIALHGAGGGYEQGLILGGILDPTKYRIVAPSRPGHRGTPLATGPTFEEQADAIATLMDRLGIERADILCISGGGLPAFQFAIRYPHRCRSLILVSAHGPDTLTFLPSRKLLWMFEGVAFADMLVWLIVKLSPRYMLRLEGSDVRRLDDERMEMTREFIANMFPSLDWADGTRNDVEQLFACEDAPEWPLERIATPTLILHGKRDFVVRYASARRHAERLRSATLKTYDDGTHFAFFTHYSEMKDAITAFLERQSD